MKVNFSKPNSRPEGRENKPDKQPLDLELEESLLCQLINSRICRVVG